MLITNPSQANVSCSAVNRVGEGIQDSTAIQACDNNIIIIVVIDIIITIAIMIKIMIIITAGLCSSSVHPEPGSVHRLHSGFYQRLLALSGEQQDHCDDDVDDDDVRMMMAPAIASLLCQISIM